jgi:hypothetical protein
MGLKKGFNMFKTLTGAALAALALTAATSAQDYGLSPAYGSVSLSGGFSPDPYTINLLSGGTIDASRSIGGNCRGFVANAPDFRLQFSPGSLPLILSVASGSDTTLVVNGPDGQWYCDDDGGNNGLNPALRFGSPMAGQYDIWVGTYGNASNQGATLNISELYSQ